jgi:hypothetical protein
VSGQCSAFASLSDLSGLPAILDMIDEKRWRKRRRKRKQRKKQKRWRKRRWRSKRSREEAEEEADVEEETEGQLKSGKNSMASYSSTYGN